MSSKVLSLPEAHVMAVEALTNHNTDPINAALIADALVAAEADGQKGHGLSRLESYCGQAASGKVDGFAQPHVTQVADAAIRVDARFGFAYPAMVKAIEKLAGLTPLAGIAVAAIHNSHHCGVAGYHVEALARQGFVGLLLANTPNAIAPWGGNQGVYGTNPIAFATPRPKKPPLVIDLSLSKVARGKIMFASQEGQSIPEGWALDSEGNPTTDPRAALDGTMLPMGDAKGSVLVLMVEILAAALTGANLGFEASSFFTPEGQPPAVGQLLIAMAPGPLSGSNFSKRLETLLSAIEGQVGTRLPGDRRMKLRAKALQEGISLTSQQYEKLQQLCATKLNPTKNSVLSTNKRDSLKVEGGNSMIQFLIHEKADSVGVATVDISAGSEATGLYMDSQENVKVKALDDIPLGHKIALTEFNEGDSVIKYGEDIGKVVAAIKKGNHVHIHNLKTKRW